MVIACGLGPVAQGPLGCNIACGEAWSRRWCVAIGDIIVICYVTINKRGRVFIFLLFTCYHWNGKESYTLLSC